jgi:hypothetical protein
MSAITGVMRNGQVVLDGPADLPEGTRVEVVPVGPARLAWGLREEDWPTTPEGIAALVARMEQVEPLLLSSEEEAGWKAGLKAQREYRHGRGGSVTT